MAFGDTETRIATPYRTLERAKGKAEAEILKLIEGRTIETVVAGLPLDEDGGRTTQCDKIENFCRRLVRRVQVQLIFVDEHLSSATAEQQLISGGASKKSSRQKGVLDTLAAAIILQSYLDSE